MRRRVGRDEAAAGGGWAAGAGAGRPWGVAGYEVGRQRGERAVRRSRVGVCEWRCWSGKDERIRDAGGFRDAAAGEESLRKIDELAAAGKARGGGEEGRFTTGAGLASGEEELGKGCFVL